MKESKELELKSTITNTFLKTVSAFSNYNTGKIIFGIDDNGKILDEVIEKHKKEWEEILSNWICNAFEPNVSKLITIYPDEKPFRIKIKKGDTKPYYYKDRRRNEFKRCIYKSGEYKKSCKL